MIDHFEIKTINFEQCKKFYEISLLPLGIELKWADEAAAGFGMLGADKVMFLIEKHGTSTPSHIAFSASDQAAVEAFHQAGISCGFQCNGAPGIREHYSPDYFAAFLLDPDGNNIEAVVYI
ncbi:VOC family protein [Endozoicomonas arenosclerae]|uniref:VOC family protein n=1 Tax=Endozoicomonas arenosclerae TaxID=1633495 RepID=UPI00078106D3|nr:VOC family protein [Endozoicomonas arenosclerae]